MIQNEPTGRMIKVTRATGRSSDYLGPCEICSKNMPEAYAARYGKERELMVKSISINPEVAHMAIENVYCNLLMLNLIY